MTGRMTGSNICDAVCLRNIKGGLRPNMAGLREFLPRASATFWALCILLATCFALGGSARGDVASLMVLRPIAILLLGFGLSRLRMAQVREHWFPVALALAMLALPAVQLIPLPPDVWPRLPGRELIAQIDRVAGLGRVWRPLSMTPDATRNALFAALVPFAVFVLGIQLEAGERSRILPFVLGLCGISALVSLVQILGEPDGPFYFYAITNNGAAVGLFANRNHQALLLAMSFPMLAVMARGHGGGGGLHQLVAVAAGLVLLPLIFITGSRSGLLVAVLALLATPLLLGSDPDDTSRAATAKGKPSRTLLFAGYAGLGLVGAGVVALTIGLGRDVAWSRLLASEPADDARLQILPTLFSMIHAYAPTGSGMGSFLKVFQVHEPDALLGPTYANHAHDDWLEFLLEGGVAAALILILAIFGFLIQSRRALAAPVASSPVVRYARLGLIMVLLTAAASVSDYPLRVPSLAALFAVAVLWAGCALPEKRSSGALR